MKLEFSLVVVVVVVGGAAKLQGSSSVETTSRSQHSEARLFLGESSASDTFLRRFVPGRDANDASELLKLNVASTNDESSKQNLETDSNTSVKCGFQRNSSDQSSTRSNKSRHTASRSKGLG